MKVLSITPTFLPEVGGLEQVVLELALRVREHGIEMDVAHVAPGLDCQTESVHGAKVYRIPMYGSRLIGWAPALRSIARNYDLLHVHDPQLLAITANVHWACRDIRAMLSTHGGFWHTNNVYLLKRLFELTLLRGAVRHYYRVLATSVGDLEYNKRYTNRVDLCNNGVNVKEFSAVPRKECQKLYQWIYWGRLSTNKRVDLAINYVAHARRLGRPVQLLICGLDFDHLMRHLKAQVARLGLNEAVRFQPFLDGPSLCAELSKRSLYITASMHEGFGLSVVEAMAAGLIVVCRNISPLNRFFIHGKSGWFLRFDGTQEDLQALNKLLLSTPGEVETMSHAARRAATAFDWETAAPRFVDQYRKALSSETKNG